MKQYTRRSALKLLGIGTVTIAGFGLAGCSGSGEGVKNASEPVPASQAFGQAGVWMVYDGDKQIGKDVAIEKVLSFDGNGNVASYQCKSLTFGDLDGLSDDEIVELAKQQDEAAFNAAKQAAIDATDEAIQAWQPCYDTLKAEADAGTYVRFDRLLRRLWHRECARGRPSPGRRDVPDHVGQHAGCSRRCKQRTGIQ